MARYDALADHLEQINGKTCTLTFTMLEDLVGLPQSAYEHRPWWANDASHSQAKAWLGAGWVVARGGVVLGKQITFERVR